MRTLLCSSLLSICLLQLGCGGGGGEDTCATLTGYKATSTAALTFATDIAPILASTATCGVQLACHGNAGGASMPVKLNSAGTTLLLTADAAAVRTALLGPSVNAPTMVDVKPGDVAGSFLAYKLMGKAGLACVKSSCVQGGSVSPTLCGDAMPSGANILSASDRTKILDWIAQGAN